MPSGRRWMRWVAVGSSAVLPVGSPVEVELTVTSRLRRLAARAPAWTRWAGEALVVSKGFLTMKAILFDYGAGNLHSLGKALTRAGAEVRVEADPARATQ